MTALPGQHPPIPSIEPELRLARRIAAVGILASALLALLNLSVGFLAGSTSVAAAGFEFLGDVLASFVVWAGMLVASKPADDNHPYGHGRFESIAGLAVGIIVGLGGIGICIRSIERVGVIHAPPEIYAIWPLLIAILVRSIMSTIKFRAGRRMRSSALVADAWNDAVDILSSAAALVALGLTIYNPRQFLAADHYGGFTVGLVVILTGLRVMHDASLDLMDTMPTTDSLDEIWDVVQKVPGVVRVEKCFARKTGLQYHVDIHLEVDPNLTVWESHDIATDARFELRRKLPWVADAMVHIEPAPGIPRAVRQPDSQD